MKIRGAFEQVLEVASSVSAMSGVELVNYIYSSFGSVAQYRRCDRKRQPRQPLCMEAIQLPP